MDSKAKELLLHFSHVANRGFLYPLDWERFYAFTVYVHQQKLSVDVQDVRDVLTADWWPKVRAEQLAAGYKNSLTLLRRYGRTGLTYRIIAWVVPATGQRHMRKEAGREKGLLSQECLST